MKDRKTQRIIDFLDKYLIDTSRDEISPVEANRLLEQAGLLRDNQQRPGLTLRNLLRKGKLSHAYQVGGKGSGWSIPLSSMAKKPKEDKIGAYEGSSIESGSFSETAITSGQDDRLSGQSSDELRKQLLKAYGRCCAITGCEVEVSLEAALIVPSLGPLTNHITNAILLRADIRVLFDLYTLTIDPTSNEVLLSPKLENSSYSNLKGIEITLPHQPELHPDLRALEYHYDEFMKSNN